MLAKTKLFMYVGENVSVEKIVTEQIFFRQNSLTNITAIQEIDVG